MEYFGGFPRIRNKRRICPKGEHRRQIVKRHLGRRDGSGLDARVIKKKLRRKQNEQKRTKTFYNAKRDGIMGFGNNVIIVYEDSALPTPNNPGKPNSRYDLMKPGGKGPSGEKTSRWTGRDGRPTKDKHYNHGGKGHGPEGFPHKHEWGPNGMGEGY
jgi:hypothetical protein